MSVSSRCHICDHGDVEHTCDRCGNLVCDTHFEKVYGVCVECVADVGDGGTPEYIPDSENVPDDVDTYRF